MAGMMQVGELAEASGVSIRTLHYYEEIGLLRPCRRTASGYRLYGETEVLRLQQILIRRELGFALNDIARVLDDPAFDLRRALLEQRAELVARAGQTQRMIAAIDAALQEQQPMKQSTKQTMAKLFDGFDPDAYADEVRARWGDTDAYRISQQRVGRYTQQDWQAYRDESAAIYRDAAALLAAGTSPESDAAMDVAERHRLSIDRWFYPCGHAMHGALADGYEADARFAGSIDRFGAGLTPFLAAAIRANASRQQR
jgi:DNA-binding transcriptional MerR regulator